ncbi:MAG: hypothetical protein GEV08_04035 [Acidimicrobiia bacterium]|nr:hypothetical protein [Acidimicrobiia bacterium]
MTQSTSSAARDNLHWARQEVLDLLSDLALAAGDEGARRVADRIERMWRASEAPDLRLALLFQLGAVATGAFEVVGEIDPELHPVEVSAAIARRLPAGFGSSPADVLAGADRIAV